jgi:hypothetical protein
MDGLVFAFSGVRMIEIDEANPVFGICEGFVVSYEPNSLVRYFASSEAVCVANIYEQIGAGCFSSREDVSRVTFETGSRVSVLGSGAFAFCERLESICIIRTVETICDYCFFACWRLRTVTFERGSRVSVIADDAFHDCSSLKSICIPSSVTTIGANCFFDCSSLSVVEVESDCRVSSVGHLAFFQCSASLHLPPRLIECLPPSLLPF